MLAALFITIFASDGAPAIWTVQAAASGVWHAADYRELREDGGFELREDGSYELRDIADPLLWTVQTPAAGGWVII